MLSELKSYLLYQANQNNNNSVSADLREKRLRIFFDFCNTFPKPLRILDLGGSDYHWKGSVFINNKDFHITIVNTETPDIKDYRNFSFIRMDVRNLDYFDDKEFGIVYSNSLLEHINSLQEQKKLAEEIQRIGVHYFIQTPNYFFPVEPHFLFPFFQFFPSGLKTSLVSRYDLGWFKKQEDKSEARKLATSIRLLKKNELMKLFPEGKLYNEKKFLLNKSFIIYN